MITSIIIHYLSWQGEDLLGPSFVRVADDTPGAGDSGIYL
jgi:hypothetical protein